MKQHKSGARRRLALALVLAVMCGVLSACGESAKTGWRAKNLYSQALNAV